MNLVKLQEDLKGLPLQALQQYANGANPEVPPYLAAAEMQRRQAAMQRASNAQATQGGPQPSVKEQLEQRLGLGALQAQQQQQAMQGLVQQRAQQPMPVPPGAPQPEAQPEPPMGMARGGVASLPVRDDMFAYADGGVIGFQAGGSATQKEVERVLKKHPRERTSEDNAVLERAGYKLTRQSIPQDSMIRRLDAALGGTSAGPDGSDARFARGPMAAGISDQPPAAPPAKAAPAVAPSRAPASSARPPRAAPPAAAPAPQGLGALAEGIVREQLAETPTMPTEAEGISSEQKLASQYGLDKPYGAEQRKLMDQMRADYEKRKESRGLETLIAGLAGGARGYGGVAAGYLDAVNAQRAYDDDFARRMLELTGSMEATDRETAASRAERATDLYKGRRTEATKKAEDRRATARGIVTAEERAADQAALASLRASLKGAGSGAGGKLNDLQKAELKNLQDAVKAARDALSAAKIPSAQTKARADLEAAQRDLDAFMRRAGGAPSPAPAPAAQSGTKATPASSGSWGAMKVN